MSLTTHLRETLRRAVQNKNAAPKKAPPDAAQLLRFEIRENLLCGQLGLSRDEIRRRRLVLLVQGAHWDYIDKRVLLNALGVEILRQTAHSDLWAADLHGRAAGRATANSEAPRGPIALLPEKNPPPVAFTGELVVWQASRHNPRLLTAYLPGTDPDNPLNLVTCLVRDNSNFLRGQKMPGPGRVIHQIDEQRYELQGAPPRYRGRW